MIYKKRHLKKQTGPYTIIRVLHILGGIKMTYDNKDDFIAEHMPFIIKTVATFTGKYVEIENSEELSVAIEAFSFAMEKYVEGKGFFYAFAKKVITNKLIDEARKQSKIITIPLDESHEGVYENFEADTLFKQELKCYEEYLSHYQISYDQLILSAPKHKETRRTILELGKKLHEDEAIASIITKNKRLPITEISKQLDVSKKVLKTHKNMLVAIFIAYNKNITSIVSWIENI